MYPFADGSKRQRSAKVAPTLVTKFRLDDLLVHVPLPEGDFVWDTLKVDIQGADVDALVSCGQYLKYFTCVVGEFDTQHYRVPKNVQTNPADVLKSAGFVNTKLFGHSLWINPRHKKAYLKDPESFGCHRVYDVKIDLDRLKSAFRNL